MIVVILALQSRSMSQQCQPQTIDWRHPAEVYLMSPSITDSPDHRDVRDAAQPLHLAHRDDSHATGLSHHAHDLMTSCRVNTSGHAAQWWKEAHASAIAAMPEEIKCKDSVHGKVGTTLWDVANASLEAHGHKGASVAHEMKRIADINHISVDCNDLRNKEILLHERHAQAPKEAPCPPAQVSEPRVISAPTPPPCPEEVRHPRQHRSETIERRPHYRERDVQPAAPSYGTEQQEYQSPRAVYPPSNAPVYRQESERLPPVQQPNPLAAVGDFLGSIAGGVVGGIAGGFDARYERGPGFYERPHHYHGGFQSGGPLAGILGGGFDSNQGYYEAPPVVRYAPPQPMQYGYRPQPYGQTYQSYQSNQANQYDRYEDCPPGYERPRFRR